jgi:hypothetical protein
MKLRGLREGQAARTMVVRFIESPCELCSLSFLKNQLSDLPGRQGHYFLNYEGFRGARVINLSHVFYESLFLEPLESYLLAVK